MKIVREKITDLDLEHTFDCGQCFRWNREADGSYTGVAFGRVINIVLKEDKLTIDHTTDEEFDQIWIPYFDLTRDYGKIMGELAAADETMKEAIVYGRGLRILQQDKWETLISFIISQNNNILRIKKCIETLCENFGAYAGEYHGKKYYAMPSFDVLANLTLEDLASCKLGYRANYILETAKLVAADGGRTLESTGAMTTEDALAYLLSLSGVGPKVANCILLFSMGKDESFPIDVWIKRVMNRFYQIEEKDMKKMQDFAAETFGVYGGIAQQYLFYYIRSNPC